MTKVKIILIFILLFLGSSYIRSQIDTSKQVVPDTTDLNSFRYQEKLLESTLEDTEDSKLLDKMDYLKSKPLDLNTATREQLEEVPFMTSIAAKKIIDYRTKNGNLKSKRELLKIDGISQEFYEKIKIYIVAKNSKTDFVKDETGKIYKESDYYSSNIFKNIDVKYRTRVQKDIQEKQGYIDGDYQGSNQKIYNRLTVSYDKKDYSIGANLTLEKDAGETSLTDFYSGYIDLKNWKFVNKAIVGDYGLNFGQGLGLWSSLAFSKGAEAVSVIKKNNYKIDSYRSTNEVQFFRGAATNLEFGKYNFFFFYSDNYYDASVDTTLDEVSSLYYDGYHRTTSEINRENASKERLLGGRVFANYGFLRLGTTYWTSKFSKPITPDSVKQLYNFSGNSANMISVDYDIIYKNFNMFGEFARSQSGSVAGMSALAVLIHEICRNDISVQKLSRRFCPCSFFWFR